MNCPEKMEYKITEPHKALQPFIQFYWELKGEQLSRSWERVFPDGCAGIFINLGTACLTDNGSQSLEFGKTYVVGAMTSYKDSLIDSSTHLLGVCLKPATFANFYNYTPQHVLTNNTIVFDKSNSFNINKILKRPFSYLNQFYTDRIITKDIPLHAAIQDIHLSNGQLCIHKLAKQNFTTTRQLERIFKKLVGLTPKQYSNIIRFQNAMDTIKNSDKNRSLLDIALECGYYDHSHLTNEIKRITGLTPSQL